MARCVPGCPWPIRARALTLEILGLRALRPAKRRQKLNGFFSFLVLTSSGPLALLIFSGHRMFLLPASLLQAGFVRYSIFSATNLDWPLVTNRSNDVLGFAGFTGGPAQFFRQRS